MRFKAEIKDGKHPPSWYEFDSSRVATAQDALEFAHKETQRWNQACADHLFQAASYSPTGRIRILRESRNLHSWRITNPNMKGCSKYLYYEVRCSKCGMRAHRVGYMAYTYICADPNGHHNMSICPC